MLVFVWGGHWLDERYGTEPRYFLIGAGLGLLAAFYHFYQHVQDHDGRQAMTLTRYATIVLGVVAATLAAAWPVLAAESRAAVLTGAALAAANTVLAYLLAVSAVGRSPNVFVGAVLGGMVARMGVMLLAAVVAAVLVLGAARGPPGPVAPRATSSPSCVFELAVLHRRMAHGGRPRR